MPDTKTNSTEEEDKPQITGDSMQIPAPETEESKAPETQDVQNDQNVAQKEPDVENIEDKSYESEEFEEDEDDELIISDQDKEFIKLLMKSGLAE
ncbi:hypothetical protein HOA73_00115, partial [Candidatus Peregrinibacteria bacterium]|nr:hypothetical protein [Candidatus Peregrinibacteria bacterium]